MTKHTVKQTSTVLDIQQDEHPLYIETRRTGGGNQTIQDTVEGSAHNQKLILKKFFRLYCLSFRSDSDYTAQEFFDFLHTHARELFGHHSIQRDILERFVPFCSIQPLYPESSHFFPVSNHSDYTALEFFRLPHTRATELFWPLSNDSDYTISLFGPTQIILPTSFSTSIT